MISPLLHQIKRNHSLPRQIKQDMYPVSIQGMGPKPRILLAAFSPAMYSKEVLATAKATTGKVGVVVLQPGFRAERAAVLLRREGENLPVARWEGKLSFKHGVWLFDMSVGTFEPKPEGLLTLRVQLHELKMLCKQYDWKNIILPHDYVAQELTKGFLQKNKFCDFHVVCKEQRIPCHRFILSSRSKVLDMILTNDSAEAQSGELIIKEFGPNAVYCFIAFLYSGKLPPHSMNSNVNLTSEVFQLAEKYQVHSLREACCDVLLQNMSHNNASDILCLARMFKIGHLEERAKEFVANEAKDVVKTDSWEELISSDPKVAGEIIARLVDN